jgi:hypothetical protein
VLGSEHKEKECRCGSLVYGLARLAFSHAALNLCIASSRVAAVPFVAPDLAGQIEVIDQVHSKSRGSKREPDSRMRPTTLPSAMTS